MPSKRDSSDQGAESERAASDEQHSAFMAAWAWKREHLCAPAYQSLLSVASSHCSLELLASMEICSFRVLASNRTTTYHMNTGFSWNACVAMHMFQCVWGPATEFERSGSMLGVVALP
jgi:hypothetical protein